MELSYKHAILMHEFSLLLLSDKITVVSVAVSNKSSISSRNLPRTVHAIVLEALAGESLSERVTPSLAIDCWMEVSTS